MDNPTRCSVLRSRLLSPRSAIVAALALAGLALVACDGGADGPSYTNADLMAPGPHALGYRSFTLVDDSRPTSGSADASALPDRTLPVDLYYPALERGADAAPVLAGGPRPLVVFAHGFMGDRKNFAGLAELLVSHGLVVAALDFPRTHMGTAGGVIFEDVRYQPGDVGFLIDALLGRSADPGDPLAGLLDGRVVLMGHSLGAFTAVLAGFHPAERHPAVEAVILLAGSACSVPDTTFDGPALPLLILHGDRDALIAIEDGAPLFAAAQGPRWMVTLLDGTHTGFVDATAELFAGLTHVDSVGCDAISGALPEEVDPAYVDWITGLGGALLATDCTPTCSDPAILERGMSTLRQVELMDAAVRAFLASVLDGDAAAKGFLDRGLADQNPDVTVEVAP